MSDQQELFKAETTWFHVFKDMIDNGDLAKLDGSAVKCYLVIKAHTNFATGRAFPGIETIAKAAGLTERQVIRCIQSLEEVEYITKEKKGRSNHYTLREKVCIKDDDGHTQALATWDYIPGSVKHAVADLKNVLVTGDMGGAKIVTIQNLTVNINNGENQTNITVNESTDKALASANKRAEAAEEKGRQLMAEIENLRKAKKAR